ncbi:hypothetical protein CSB69_2194 [Morganella morganii]|nr:hypothetical protein CSB69_2194 [Morganella morganii]
MSQSYPLYRLRAVFFAYYFSVLTVFRNKQNRENIRISKTKKTHKIK